MVAIELNVPLSFKDGQRLLCCLEDKEGVYEPRQDEYGYWGKLEAEGYVRESKKKFSLSGGAYYELTGLGRQIAEQFRYLTMLSDLPEWGTHMPVEEFAACVEAGGFIDYDGWGHLATAYRVSNIEIRPSNFEDRRDDAVYTHVVWYNK